MDSHFRGNERGGSGNGDIAKGIIRMGIKFFKIFVAIGKEMG